RRPPRLILRPKKFHPLPQKARLRPSHPAWDFSFPLRALATNNWRLATDVTLVDPFPFIGPGPLVDGELELVTPADRCADGSPRARPPLRRPRHPPPPPPRHTPRPQPPLDHVHSRQQRFTPILRSRRRTLRRDRLPPPRSPPLRPRRTREMPLPVRPVVVSPA